MRYNVPTVVLSNVGQRVKWLAKLGLPQDAWERLAAAGAPDVPAPRESKSRSRSRTPKKDRAPSFRDGAAAAAAAGTKVASKRAVHVRITAPSEPSESEGWGGSKPRGCEQPRGRSPPLDRALDDDTGYGTPDALRAQREALNERDARGRALRADFASTDNFEETGSGETGSGLDDFMKSLIEGEPNSADSAQRVAQASGGRRLPTVPAAATAKLQELLDQRRDVDRQLDALLLQHPGLSESPLLSANAITLPPPAPRGGGAAAAAAAAHHTSASAPPGLHQLYEQEALAADGDPQHARAFPSLTAPEHRRGARRLVKGVQLAMRHTEQHGPRNGSSTLVVPIDARHVASVDTCSM